MTLEERISGLENNLAEAVDLLRHLTWGHHADDVHSRAFDLLDKVEEQANKVRLEPIEGREIEIPTLTTGRKFR